jgi:hypothetical protein
MVTFRVKIKANPPGSLISPLTSLESALAELRECVSKQRTLTIFRINTYKPWNVVFKTKDFKPCRINTYAILCSKQFRINTYEKRGGGGGLSSLV